MPSRLAARTVSRFAAIATSLAVAACSSDDTTAPPKPVEGAFTVDASKNWVYVSLRDSAIVTPTPSAGESNTWDVAFFASNVTLNGGPAGPGGVTGACICQNAQATDNDVLAMTTVSEQPDFDAVVAVPAGLTFVSDALTPAVGAWFTGTGASAAADPSKVFLVRLSDSLAFAKVRVTKLEGASATSAGRVSVEFAVQATSTAPLGTAQTVVIDLTTAGAKSLDLNTGALTTSATAWDLRFDGFNIRVNGGVSGPGKGGAAAGTGTFESITTASIQANAYRTDTYAGVFGTNRWYRYNIRGDNRLSPTFDVYLLRRGTQVFKLQIVNYYDATNQPRFITFRYKQIAG